MLKQALVVFAFVALAFSAPEPKKLFHEHVEEFIDIIMAEAGHDLEHLMEHYIEFEEFWVSLEYMRTDNFKKLVYEMESLPEFVAVLEFLEQNNIDIYYFVESINNMIESVDVKRNARHTLSGRDFSAFIKDCISEFPKQKLAALYDQKMSEDGNFKAAMESLESDEWDQIYGALWDSSVFQAEMKTLLEHGIDIVVLFDQIIAIFGQN